MTYLSDSQGSALNGPPLPQFLPIDTGSNFSIVLQATMARVLISQEMRLWSFDVATSWYENVPKTMYDIFHAVSFINYV